MTPPTAAAPACTIKLTTALGCYVVSRPATAYKKVWAELQAQVALTAEVMQVRGGEQARTGRPRRTAAGELHAVSSAQAGSCQPRLAP